MEEMSGQGQKASTHPTSRVVMNIAAFKVSHSLDTNATALPAARARSASIGAMEEMSQKVQKSECTLDATFWYTFELISVASPPS